MIDEALARIGQVIGKPPGWERVVRAIVPPQRYANEGLDLVRQSDGYVFPIDRGTLIGWSIHFFGAYEPEVRAEIRRRLRPGDTAIDVGANAGWHTLLMACRVGPGGRVVAIEPNRSSRERLEHAIAINRLTHVRVDSRALADREGTRPFEAPPAGDVWDGTGRLVGDGEVRVKPDATTTVNVTTIDALAAEHSLDRVALIKIDVEGWEPAVLRGAANVLRTSRPALIFEYDAAYVERSGTNAAELVSWLRTFGYQLHILRPRGAPLRVAALGHGSTNVLALCGREDLT
ncbi:MAG TPA: FkbM family methyltransferase [Vicinamibacterales bacterium]|jgi:FkbM family methyltransferase